MVINISLHKSPYNGTYVTLNEQKMTTIRLVLVSIEKHKIKMAYNLVKRLAKSQLETLLNLTQESHDR